ncbi:unnamed protein product [Aphanomyces euteiches]
MKNLFNWLIKQEAIVTNIGDARKLAPNTDVMVQGKVTSAAGTFYDAIYVQDATGGIMAFNDVPATLPIRLGDTVRVYGHIKTFENNIELEFDRNENSIIKVSSGLPVAPSVLPTGNAASGTNLGLLVQVQGKVLSVDDGSYVVDDGSGPVLIFTDGYIANQSDYVPDVKVGDTLKAIGLSGGYADGTRLRVRDTKELVVTSKCEVNNTCVKTASDIAASISSITAPSQDAISLILPTVPSEFTIAIKTSNNTNVIKTDRTIIPPSAATTVTLVLEVTRTSDNSKASTGNIAVIVPAKTVIPLTAAEVAATITSIVAPLQDVTSLTLPPLANGYTVAIKSSDKLGVIQTDGTITPPSSATTVTLVLEVTRTWDNSKASTGNIVVVVPAKTVIPLTAAEVAATIISIVAPLQDVASLTLPTLANGYTVAIKSSDKPAVIQTDGTITPPSSATTVTLVLEVTRTWDNSKASTGNIVVVVPAKTVIPLTAAEVAATIISIVAPQQDAASLTLPTLANGYTVAIKSSSNTAVIGLNGTITPPSSATTVTLVLEVTRTLDNSKASTGNIAVVVPAKSVQTSTPTSSPVGSTPTSTPAPTLAPTPTPTPSNDGKSETIATVKSDKLVNNGNSGKSTVEVPANTTEVKLPSNTSELLGNSKLEITSDKITLNVPSDLIKQLEGKFTSDELKDSTISLKFDPLSASDAKDIAAKSGNASNATVKLAGDVYEFSLSITSVDGKVEKLTKFDQPITLRMKVDPTVNQKLVSVYYISDSGQLEFVGGELINGEMIVQISHFSKYAVLEFNKTFTDVAANYWAFNVIQELAAKQTVNGTSDTAFEPERAITRAEFTALLVKALNLTKEGNVKFADVSANDWYTKAVSIAYQAGIVNGKSTTTFDPNGKITREEMVTMIMHAYELLKGKATVNTSMTFADESKVSSWALGYLKSASALNLIHGRTANQFVPKGTTTRAEAAQVIYNLLPSLK